MYWIPPNFHSSVISNFAQKEMNEGESHLHVLEIRTLISLKMFVDSPIME